MATQTTKTNKRILWITQLALLTAITIVLQMLGSFIRFGPFQIALVLVPIVIGACVLGMWEGGWLGMVFGLVVLLNGDAAPFMAVSVPASILLVLVKGACAGLAAGLIYKLFSKKNTTAAVIAASAAAPIVNTGVFVLGCYAFFIPLLTEWANGKSVTSYLFLTMIGTNFLIELAVNLVLSGVIVRIVALWKNKKAAA